MNSFDTYLLKRIYKKIAKLGDKLAEADTQIDWTTFRPIIQGLYTNNTPRGGRPNADEVVMVKLLVLQQWYGFSDEELERQANDRISFQRFLGYPDPVPDSTTIWLFQERLAETGKDSEVWAELQRQLDEKGLGEGKETAQDASLITADPGQSSGKPRGGGALTRRSRDGAWVKRRESVFGFKLHVKMDLGFDLVRAVAVTSASVHDSRVDLSEPGEVVYRDKGYFGVEPRGWDATMRRGVRGHLLCEADRSRNRRIGLKRRPVERTFAVLKRVFHAGHMLVASVARVRVKMVFSCLCFNLVQLGTLGVASVA
jgi:IS5 family transposase